MREVRPVTQQRLGLECGLAGCVTQHPKHMSHHTPKLHFMKGGAVVFQRQQVLEMLFPIRWASDAPQRSLLHCYIVCWDHRGPEWNDLLKRNCGKKEVRSQVFPMKLYMQIIKSFNYIKDGLVNFRTLHSADHWLFQKLKERKWLGEKYHYSKHTLLMSPKSIPSVLKSWTDVALV